MRRKRDCLTQCTKGEATRRSRKKAHTHTHTHTDFLHREESEETGIFSSEKSRQESPVVGTQR